MAHSRTLRMKDQVSDSSTLKTRLNLHLVGYSLFDYIFIVELISTARSPEPIFTEAFLLWHE